MNNFRFNVSPEEIENIVPLETLPHGEVITEMIPLVLEGTTAVICVGLFTANDVAETPLNFTSTTFTKFAPVITTHVPAIPEAGTKPEILCGVVIVIAIAFDEVVAVVAPIVNFIFGRIVVVVPEA